MGEVSKHFIEQFHNIPGDTVGEKRRNLFLLIRQNHSSLTENEKELESLAINLKPTCYLERTFRIEFLIHFKRFKELLQDCLDGDEVALKRVAKQDWFFQNVFKCVEPEEFVTNTLPAMPYVFKFKVLRKLPVEEQQADIIFDALLKRYGMVFATIFLPKCSVNKIEETLKKHFIKLIDPQLQILCDKHLNLISVYFEERKKHEGNIDFMNNHPFFLYLAEKNPEMFAKLYNKYKFEIYLGYRTTKKLIDSQKDEILKNLESYLEILNKKALVKKLGSGLQRIFFEKFPLRTKLNWNVYLKYYPKSQRFDFFKLSYNSKYYQKFGDNIDAINKKMLKIINDPVERENLAKLKYQKTNDKMYLQYVTPSYCLKEFKEKLSQITVSEKADYVEHATICCLLNRDLDALLELCELVAGQFKNDERDARGNLLYPFGKYYSILDQFSEQHWKFMMEIVATSHAKQDWVYDDKIRMKYMEYLVKHDKPVRDIILKFSDWPNLFKYQHDITRNPKIYRKILCELLETEPRKEEEDIRDYYISLIECCRLFDKKKPDCTINIMEHPKIIEIVNSILEMKPEPAYGCSSEIEYIVCRKDSSEILEKFKMLYFKNFKTFGETSGCLWFLKNEPKTFQKYLNYFLENFDGLGYLNYRQIWCVIRQYNYLGLDKDIVEYCKSKLETDGVLKKKLVEALAILSPVESYYDLIKTHVQVTDKKEVTDEDDEKDPYTTKCNLIKYLHFVRSPTTVLPIALQFCKEDFLKFALCPLYSSVYRLPENKMRSLIEQLSRDENLKNHAVHLSCVVLDLTTSFNYLRDTPSLMCLSKYLAKNPCDAVWDLIETILPIANSKDLYVFKWVMRKTLPSTYKTKYIEAIWNFLNKCENTEMKKMMFTSMDQNIVQKLPPNFAYKLIEESIFKIEESDDLISSLLIHMNDPNKYEFIKNTFGVFKENCWTCKAIRRNAKHKFYEFIKSISKTYFEAESTDEDFEKKFLEIFTSLFSSSEAFEEFVMVSFMKLKGRKVEDCGEVFVEFNNDLVAVYGRSIVNLLASALKEHILPNVFTSEDEKMKLCYFVFKSKKSLDDYLLIINLLPETEPEDVEQYQMYNEILSGLEQVTDDNIINLQFNCYLRGKNAKENTECEFDPRIAICPCK